MTTINEAMAKLMKGGSHVSFGGGDDDETWDINLDMMDVMMSTTTTINDDDDDDRWQRSIIMTCDGGAEDLVGCVEEGAPDIV